MSSVTHIVDNEKVLNEYEYDAWGEVVSEKETVKNRFKFNGQQLDLITQQYYLRARFYNPVIARFTQEDTYRGDGLNLYAYCGNNPVYYVDPTGHKAQCDKDAYKAAYDDAIEQGYDAAVAKSIARNTEKNHKVDRFEEKNAQNQPEKPQAEKVDTGLYGNLEEPRNVGVGKNFTDAQKRRILAENMKRNGGVVKSDVSGEILFRPAKSQKGVTPPQNEWQIDHIISKDNGGGNSNNNAQVLSRKENRDKWK